jgi:hypothetical protein
MASSPSEFDALLQPVPGELDTGDNLRFTPVWSEIVDALPSEDIAGKGIWQAEGGPVDWGALAQLLSRLLREESKDLRLAAWYGVALIRLHGFAGAVQSCQLIRRLLEVYGERLHPRGEDDDRVPFARSVLLFDRCVAEALHTAPILEGGLAGRGCSLADFDGISAAQAFAAAASVSAQQIDDALESVTACAADLAEAAAAAANIAPCSFDRLSAVLDAWQTALLSIRRRAGKSVEIVRSDVVETPIPVTPPSVPATTDRLQMPVAAAVNQPRNELTFVEFRREDAAESSGRGRFYQKLAAVEVCIRSGRYRSARVLLSELLDLIDRLALQEWEPRWATSTVYRGYLELLSTAPSESGDAELAARIFDRWVRFDPRAAMEFGDRIVKNGPGKFTP